LISKQTIDQVYEAARVEEVIGDYVQLKKSGSNFKGLSPFTDERTPSFMVSPVKQIWKDFSSGKGGNVVAFLMEHEHFNYPEAIKFLAKRYGIEIEETEQSDQQKAEASERESLYLVSEHARDYFSDVLWNTEPGKAIALTYFKERGFTDDTIRKFQLGYSLDQWEAYTNKALEDGYKLEFLSATGLTIVKEEKRFDRFKGRVIFPIRSLSGRVLGFGGRILTSDKKAAKYLNSPESLIYNKSKVLYGIYHAKQSIAKEDNCYIVEGYTDVIQLHQRGITNVVSSSGTALTPDQIRMIRRLTPNVTLLFDGDAAGLRASLRGVDLILEQGMNVRICTFPEGEDPDSFARANGLEEVTRYLSEEATDFINFKASLLARETKDDPIKKAETIRDMVQSIAKIPDAIKQEVYIKSCSQIMDISEEVLFSSLAQLIKKGERDAKRGQRASQTSPMEVVSTPAQVQKVDAQFELEQKIIELLLLYGWEEADFEELILEADEETGAIQMRPEIVRDRVYQKIYLDLQEDEIELTHPEFREIYQAIIEEYHKQQELKVEQFIRDLDPKKGAVVTNLLMNEEKYRLDDWERKDVFVKDKLEGVAQLVSETILNFRRHLITQKIDQLSNSVQETEDPAQKENSLQEIVDYLTLKKVLSDKLNRVVL